MSEETKVAETETTESKTNTINDYAFIAWISIVLIAICGLAIMGKPESATLLTLFSTLAASFGFKKAKS